jgi:MBOAT, membrane-bound O-acyltransferase family
MIWIESAIAVVCIYAAAWSLWPILDRQSPRLRHTAASLVGLILPLAGLLVERDAKLIRVLIAILGLLIGARMYSYWGSAPRGGFADYVWFLSFGLLNPHLVYSPSGFAASRPASPRREVLRLLAASAVAGITAFVAYVLLQTDAANSSWLVNYLILVVAFSVIMQAFGQGCWAVWRLLGIRSKPLVDNIWLSRTPVEFWRRWSWPPHAWLNRYVYIPWGGRAHAGRATFIVFLVSGLAHEVMVGVGLGRVTGHQTAFFLISGLGVLASEQLERLAGWGLVGEVLMRLATILFILTSATLMFTTFNYFVPLFHQPSWLEW